MTCVVPLVTAPVPWLASARSARRRWLRARERGDQRLLRSAGRADRRLVAVSGVDGAGKSSLIGQLQEHLSSRRVPVAVVWLRPGMGMRRLARLASLLKKLLGQAPGPAVRDVTSAGHGQIPSRRGAVGWVWAMVVTVSFICQLRSRLRRAGGVVLCDRYLLDAQVTLDVFYAGVDLRAHRALVRLLLRPPYLTVYIGVPLEVALSRKPGDTIGRDAVRQQIGVYERLVSDAPRLLRLDGTADPDHMLAATLARLERDGFPGAC